MPAGHGVHVDDEVEPDTTVQSESAVKQQLASCSLSQRLCSDRISLSPSPSRFPTESQRLHSHVCQEQSDVQPFERLLGVKQSAWPSPAPVEYCPSEHPPHDDDPAHMPSEDRMSSTVTRQHHTFIMPAVNRMYTHRPRWSSCQRGTACMLTTRPSLTPQGNPSQLSIRHSPRLFITAIVRNGSAQIGSLCRPLIPESPQTARPSIPICDVQPFNRQLRVKQSA